LLVRIAQAAPTQERETNAAMDLSIDKINEYEPRIIPAVRW
jgi:hypothetical protein